MPRLDESTCVDINNQGPSSELALPFAYYATTFTNFCGGKCNNCIAEGRDCTFESLGQEEGAVAEGAESEADDDKFDHEHQGLLGESPIAPQSVAIMTLREKMYSLKPMKPMGGIRPPVGCGARQHARLRYSRRCSLELASKSSRSRHHSVLPPTSLGYRCFVAGYFGVPPRSRLPPLLVIVR